jgi:hypothetical protein
MYIAVHELSAEPSRGVANVRRAVIRVPIVTHIVLTSVTFVFPHSFNLALTSSRAKESPHTIRQH